jgi:oligopeptide transport system permease protein
MLRIPAAWWPLILLLAAVLLLPLATPWDALRPDWERAMLGPDWASGHWLGTDVIGRDVLELTAAAARGSLAVAAIAALLGLLGGTLIGALAAWRGSWIDTTLVRLLALLQSLPLLLIAVLVMAVTDGSQWAMLLVLGVYVMLDVARLARAEVAGLRQQHFVLAAGVLGLSDTQVLLRHVLPNLRRFLGHALLLAVPQAVLIESFLGFLGLGASGAAQSLGSLLADGMQDVQFAPWLLLTPAVVMVWLMAAMVSLAQRYGHEARAA